ncbi:MAG: hypothetical protein ACOH5I_04715 [Oligoflexus sp.]
MFESSLTLFELCLIVSGCLAFVGALLSNWRHQMIALSLSVFVMIGLAIDQSFSFSLIQALLPATLLGFYLSLWNWRVKSRQWHKRWLNLGISLGVLSLVLWHAWQSMPHFENLIGEAPLLQNFDQNSLSKEGLWLFIAFNLIAGLFWLMKGRMFRGS